MSILPQQRPMSKSYTITISVIYMAMAGYLAYRGYLIHKPLFYGLAAILVVATIIRLSKLRSTLPPSPPPDEQKKVELFSKPKDF